jgi:hypothetical protein
MRANSFSPNVCYARGFLLARTWRANGRADPGRQTLCPSPSGAEFKFECLLVASLMVSSTTSLALDPAITTFGFLDNVVAFVVWHLYRHSVLRSV